MENFYFFNKKKRMKKIYISTLIALCASLINSIIVAENILVKNKKTKSESISKIKEQTTSDLEELLNLSTHTIKQISELIDNIVIDCKQLNGIESGPLTCCDKKTLQLYNAKIEQAKTALKEIDNCSLKIK